MSLPLDVAYGIAALVASPVWGLRMLRTGKWRTDWPGRFGHTPSLPPKPPAKRRLLFHAVSVGEVNLIRQLVAELALEPDLDLVIATTTDTGFDRASALFAPRLPVLRYPLDFSRPVRRFLDATQPDLLATVELEVWPNMVQQCRARGIGVCVVNGRLSERSLRRYSLIKPLIRPTFASLAAVAAQDDAYAARFRQVGVPADRVRVLDTMKWDTADLAADIPGSDALAAAMGIDRAQPVVVLGSTGEGEEQRLVQALLPVVSQQTQIVVVPRKPERFDEVAAALPGVVRRTRCQNSAPTPPSSRLFLLDTMGELRQAYALADVVIVGRSFNGWGASDPIEPVALAKPTIIGPAYHNFCDVVAAFTRADGIVLADDAPAAAQAAARLLSDGAAARALAQRGREVILSRRGATQRHRELLLGLLRGSSAAS